MPAANHTSLPVALSSMAGPNRMSAVIQALLQNDGEQRLATSRIRRRASQRVIRASISTSIKSEGQSSDPAAASAEAGASGEIAYCQFLSDGADGGLVNALILAPVKRA